MINKQMIGGRLGLKAWIFLVIFVFVAVTFGWFAYMTFIQHNPKSPPIDTSGWIIISIGLSFGIYVIPLITTLHIGVTEEMIVDQSIWSKSVYYWKDVAGIETFPDTFGSIVVNLRLKTGKKSLTIFVNLLANRKQVLMAIADAARKANPRVSIDPWVETICGKGPYGYFGMEKT